MPLRHSAVTLRATRGARAHTFVIRVQGVTRRPRPRCGLLAVTRAASLFWPCRICRQFLPLISLVLLPSAVTLVRTPREYCGLPRILGLAAEP